MYVYIHAYIYKYVVYVYMLCKHIYQVCVHMYTSLLQPFAGLFCNVLQVSFHLYRSCVHVYTCMYVYIHVYKYKYVVYVYMIYKHMCQVSFHMYTTLLLSVTTGLFCNVLQFSFYLCRSRVHIYVCTHMHT